MGAIFSMTRTCPFQASVNEVLWVMKAGIFGAGALATIIALAVDSIYSLFVLCSDLVFVILFPQLCCVIYFKDTNGYGALFGYFMGLLFRIGGGETKIGLQPFIKYPYYDEVEGQLFPYRTLCMLISLASIISVSYLAKYLFERKILPQSLDIIHAFRENEVEKVEKVGEHRLVPIIKL